MDLPYAIKRFNILPPDSSHLLHSAAKQIASADQDVIPLGITVPGKALKIAARSSSNCSYDKLRVFFSAVINERGGIGFHGTPVTAERIGADTQRYRLEMAAILRMNVRGFFNPASTCYLS